jgi:hypothetical protein
MKLRNKKTGAIYSIEDIDLGNNADGIWLGMTKYNSLAELNEEWEDYEEPVKPYWFINDLDGEPMKCDLKNCGKSNFIKWGNHRKQIGNYFDTREEAEKAVEKLKAITRLKKCGFKFEGYADIDRANGGDIVIYAHINIPNNNLLEEAQPAMLKDLDLLFGGEE